VLKQNPQSQDAPNQGKLGVSRDGAGGAEMIVVGGQDSANHYIEQISVFNLRSQTWTSTNPLGRSCGAYRSVTAPLSASVASQIGIGARDKGNETDKNDKPPDGGSAMLIYSNYNFLDVKLELQIHLHDGTLVEKHMSEGYSPPGLRFPNGGVINGHFVVSGTFLTSYKQEYALWALDLRNLTWSRIDIGSSTFSQGSWNRGILWSRRNSFVILGNRKRSLVEDYNHRRVNFSNICVVELEAFGLYDNPRRLGPMSGYVSASSPFLKGTYHQDFVSNLEEETPDRFAGGRELSKAAEDLGRMALSSAELSDMDFLAINGEKIPVNSRIVSRRWGPYFDKLMGEALSALEGTDTATLRPSVVGSAQSSRNSSLTITSTLKNVGGDRRPGSDPADMNGTSINPASRPRTLYLPHTPLTIQALLHFLYASALPPPTSHLCTPQILCSLLQIARPYKIDGLLEAVVERLHTVLDNRNTAAIFNAAAMAAGGGDGVEFIEDDPRSGAPGPQMKQRSNGTGIARPESPIMGMGEARGDGGAPRPDSDEPGVAGKSPTEPANDGAPRQGGEASAAAGGAAGAPAARPGTSGGDSAGEVSDDEAAEKRVEAAERPPEEVWAGSLSSVVGLQKRGLRGLMEGRRMREMGSRDTGGSGGSSNPGERVGLGIERG
jgi:hypothetical protein